MEIKPTIAILATVVGMICFVVSYALFTGWNPDALPLGIRYVQAVIAAAFSAGALVVAIIGSVQAARHLRKNI